MHLETKYTSSLDQKKSVISSVRPVTATICIEESKIRRPNETEPSEPAKYLLHVEKRDIANVLLHSLHTLHSTSTKKSPDEHNDNARYETYEQHDDECRLATKTKIETVKRHKRSATSYCHVAEWLHLAAKVFHFGRS